MDIQDAVQLAN